ncbi:hypothetical protein IFM89_009623 [Coptis chinensis]|uniref:Uncharacterized protein n=1 Tax=Coptis chinensis TaxID=261450 RepID=A0A835M9K2_9MAGN|nr:hypothetical protein IFM89_009623 [Coptis chinensis]
MVLWELALGTAYFLGLKRSYKLALKLERRLITSNHPKIRQFASRTMNDSLLASVKKRIKREQGHNEQEDEEGKIRRTRAIFDMALGVHRKVQLKDIEVGRNLGNWIVRWLDHMKPSAEIRGNTPSKPFSSSGTTKNLSNSVHQPPNPNQKSNNAPAAQKSGRVFATSLNIGSKSFPTLSMMMRPLNPFRANIQFEHLWT